MTRLGRNHLWRQQSMGGFPVWESNLDPWNQAPNRQQYMTDAIANWAKSPTLKKTIKFKNAILEFAF